MSRSVMMRGPRASGSMTTAAPTAARPSAAPPRAGCGRAYRQDHLAHPVADRIASSPFLLIACLHERCTHGALACHESTCQMSAHAAWPLGRGVERPSTPSRCRTPAPPAIRTSLFRDATTIVEVDFASDLSLDDVARRVACRVASFSAPTPRSATPPSATTSPPFAWSVRPRCSASRAPTVREVAYRVGYRQPAQFAKAFRRHHGASPSTFRAARRVSGVSGWTAPAP